MTARVVHEYAMAIVETYVSSSPLVSSPTAPPPTVSTPINSYKIHNESGNALDPVTPKSTTRPVRIAPKPGSSTPRGASIDARSSYPSPPESIPSARQSSHLSPPPPCDVRSSEQYSLADILDHHTYSAECPPSLHASLSAFFDPNQIKSIRSAEASYMGAVPSLLEERWELSPGEKSKWQEDDAQSDRPSSMQGGLNESPDDYMENFVNFDGNEGLKADNGRRKGGEDWTFGR